MKPKSPERQADVLSHFNEPMIVCSELARCIGYAEDERDCYIIVHTKSRGIYYHTYVGGYTYLDRLKGQGYVKGWNGEEWDDLWRLSNDLERAGVPKQEKPLVCPTEEEWEAFEASNPAIFKRHLHSGR